MPAVGFQDHLYLPLTGGMMTGPLEIENSSTTGPTVEFHSKDKKGGVRLRSDGQFVLKATQKHQKKTGKFCY